MQSFYDELLKVLKTDQRFFSEDGVLLRNSAYSAAMRMDPSLISMLFNNHFSRERFFTKSGEFYVFDKTEFCWIINNRELLPDSFTRFKNKIGLVDHAGNFIANSNDVCISFPYKDCVIVNDSATDTEIRHEIFYNELLASDEIDKLFSPKVFSSPERVNKAGAEPCCQFTDKDNLFIGGNNLFALYSLLPRYKGTIKCAYWDILYNTDNDKVPYNDSFKHSSWLVMMKNRLEVLKRLLRSDGTVFLQCDDNEQAYLKVLCDEIFGRENFVNCIAVKMSEATGVKMSHAGQRFPKLKEYILFYKMPGFRGFFRIDKYRSDKWDNENNIFLDNFSKEQRNELISISEKPDLTESDAICATEILSGARRIPLAQKRNELGLSDNDFREWCFENAYRIIKTCGSESLTSLVRKMDILPDQEIACALSRENILFFFITDFNKSAEQPRLRVVFADENIYKNPCDFWQDIKTTGSIANEGGVKLNNGKKPEKLVARIISMVTEPGDIVLDAYSGSGTTAAVAMKLGRRFIAIEQLDTHIQMTLKRLGGVIGGDGSGISKEYGWLGGGEFVVCGLKKLNQQFIARISAAKTDELEQIWNEILSLGLISHKVRPAEIDLHGEFSELALSDQKKLLIELLDKNQLYMNLCDIGNGEFTVSDTEREFTESFYGGTC